MTRAFSAGLKPGAISSTKLRGVDFSRHHEGRQQYPHGSHHGGENVPAFILAVLRDELGENRNKGDAERTSRHQVVQEVRQGESGVIRIGDGVRADLVGDGPIAEETQNAAGQHARHDDAGSLGNAPRYVGRVHPGRCIMICVVLPRSGQTSMQARLILILAFRPNEGRESGDRTSNSAPSLGVLPTVRTIGGGSGDKLCPRTLGISGSLQPRQSLPPHRSMIACLGPRPRDSSEESEAIFPPGVSEAADGFPVVSAIFRLKLS